MMESTGNLRSVGQDLTEREIRVLEAVVRAYVETAEPAGSRSVARQSGLGVSPATIRNTMSDLEEKGYLSHPHTSAGRVPTDLAYRFHVDQLIRLPDLSAEDQDTLARELGAGGPTAVERLIQRAARALSLLSLELGVALAPRLERAVLEKLELLRVSSNKVLLVATIRSGLARTLYVDFEGEIPEDTLATLAVLLNERLAGLTLREIRETLPDRLRDFRPDDSAAAEELLNIFIESGSNLFNWSDLEEGEILLGKTSILAAQPEFNSGESLKGLIELTERRDVLVDALSGRNHQSGLQITIGSENEQAELTDFTLVTSEYHIGGLKGVIGIIGPTRMPYEKVIAIVDSTSSLVNRILGS
ncbi:MAG: heat-inducible transcription repressor HrcA [Gemmatimonadetes bacterium]|nr:heat-inducible transcriptional repressor HrcA [Gemmatimonadota bacterium]NNM06883.1 heat-inducible transcription repressor HrcA [Gemmatimonadota bacterium]